MHPPGQAPGPSLELIFETIHGFQRTGALKAALELDVFTGIADGANTALTLARRSEASARVMRTLCDYLAVLGLLTETADRYALTPDSQAFLNKKSPAYVGTALDFLLSPPQVDPFQDVAAAVRNGGAITGQGVIAPAHPVWVTFARAMAPLMALPAERLADVLAVEQDTQAYVVTMTSVPWCTCLWFVVYCASSTGQRSSIRSTLRTSRRSSLVDAGSRPDLRKAQRPACSLEIGARLEERGMLAVLPAGLKRTALNVYQLGQLLACLFKANLNRCLAP